MLFCWRGRSGASSMVSWPPLSRSSACSASKARWGRDISFLGVCEPRLLSLRRILGNRLMSIAILLGTAIILALH
jgi:hypothetical protein